MLDYIGLLQLVVQEDEESVRFASHRQHRRDYAGKCKLPDEDAKLIEDFLDNDIVDKCLHRFSGHCGPVGWPKTQVSSLSSNAIEGRVAFLSRHPGTSRSCFHRFGSSSACAPCVACWTGVLASTGGSRWAVAS
ncbi:hypothetical protein Taro_026716 [Colocasia esculenta]|uniref:Uncharacterized protein n=1 Tax=Colocasia esculenta TaxID=4460 RepID=A0A843VDN0_COLES|nr:hypothetical protein [Colocasia esculenta]